MKLLVIFISALWFSKGHAQNVSVGEPTISGRGCPQNSVRAVLAPDGSAISILFDQFSVEADPGTYSSSDVRLVRECRFRIPVTYPRGMNIETTRLEYRGYAMIPQARTGRIKTSGPAVSRYYRTSGPPILHEFNIMNDSFYVIHQIPQNFQGRCFPVTEIDFTVQIWVGAGAPYSRGSWVFKEHTRIDFDSIDIGSSGIEVGIRAVPCR